MDRRSLILQGGLLGWLGAASGAAPAGAVHVDEMDVAKTPPPKDAVVLFGGSDLSEWISRKTGGDAAWKIEGGYMEVAPGTGDIITRRKFEDCQLHVEFWLPLMADKTGQARANSGVYLQGRYEVQVLDSYGLESKDNDCGGIYKVAPPMRNACKKPEFWQSYDILFRAPRTNAAGQTVQKGRVTVLHNNAVIHNGQEFDAMVTTAGLPGPFSEPGPMLLQDHGNKVRFRNIWIIPLS